MGMVMPAMAVGMAVTVAVAVMVVPGMIVIVMPVRLMSMFSMIMTCVVVLFMLVFFVGMCRSGLGSLGGRMIVPRMVMACVIMARMIARAVIVPRMIVRPGVLRRVSGRVPPRHVPPRLSRRLRRCSAIHRIQRQSRVGFNASASLQKVFNETGERIGHFHHRHMGAIQLLAPGAGQVRGDEVAPGGRG